MVVSKVVEKDVFEKIPNAGGAPLGELIAEYAKYLVLVAPLIAIAPNPGKVGVAGTVPGEYWAGVSETRRVSPVPGCPTVALGVM
jgi:hypothetical protein